MSIKIHANKIFWHFYTSPALTALKKVFSHDMLLSWWRTITTTHYTSAHRHHHLHHGLTFKKKRFSTSHFCCYLQLLFTAATYSCYLQLLTFMTCSYKSSCLQELQGAASLMGWIPRHGISTFLSKRGCNWSYPSCAALSDPQRYVSLVHIDDSEASLLLILSCSLRKLSRTMM